MTILPPVDKFPSFAETRNRLAAQPRECIWYITKHGRCCKIKMKQSESQRLLGLADSLAKTNSTEPALQELGELAEHCCCPQYHRDTLWGSDLVIALAQRWQRELLQHCSGVKLLMRVDLDMVGWFSTRAKPWAQYLPLEKQVTVPRQMWKAAAFSQHAVHEWETLSSILKSPLKPRGPGQGCVYIFTYPERAFRGMLKIGYTSKVADVRMEEWSHCGYGAASLVKFHNQVRHPERVESLTHFELLEVWRNLRWCNFHLQSHVEWFKIEATVADAVIQSWKSWMELAEPYDRRGCLKAFWLDMLGFLHSLQIPVTGRLMLDMYKVEMGEMDVTWAASCLASSRGSRD